MSSRSASELFEKIHSCYISVTSSDIRMYSFVGARKPMCDLPLACIEMLTFDCNTQMAKFDIVTATGSEKRYLFIIHETTNDFKKWMTMVPSILKKFNIKISVQGDFNMIGMLTGNQKKVLSIDTKKLEYLQDNSDFVIEDHVEGKIELIQRVNDRLSGLLQYYRGCK